MTDLLRMRVFMDTEFMEEPGSIELLSLGMKRADGQTFYMVNAEANLARANPWVQQNVLPHLGEERYTTEQIRQGVENFTRDIKPEFWGYYCVAPDTRVLTASLDWVPAGKLSLGDDLLGFDEDRLPGVGRSSRWRQWKSTAVTRTERIVRPCYDLVFDDGTTVRCSSDHRWLTGNQKGTEWRTTESLRSGPVGSNVVKPIDTWEEDESWTSGYLAAAFDGEGHLTQTDLNVEGKGIARVRIGFSQRENAMMRQVEGLLINRGYTVSSKRAGGPGVRTLEICRREEVLHLLGTVKPRRLMAQFRPEMLGAMRSMRTVKLVSKTFVGEQEVIALSTDAKTYIAEGLASHNCDYDWVVFCWLFGAMVDLPKSFPMYCRDIKQWCDMLGNPQLPPQESQQHNSLADAEWNEVAWQFLANYGRELPR